MEFTEEEIALIKKGLEMLDAHSLGFEAAVKRVLEKLRAQRLEGALRGLMFAARPYLSRRKMTPRPHCDRLNKKYREAEESLK